MEHGTFQFILETLQQPQGLIEIYHANIGKGPNPRIDKLESCPEADGKGLGLKYVITQVNVVMNLVLTYCSSFPPVETDQGTRYPAHPRVEKELAQFAYSHQQTYEHGLNILKNQDVGPLEHAIFQEILAKDPQHDDVRRIVGGGMVNLGKFAKELSQRGLAID